MSASKKSVLCRYVLQNDSAKVRLMRVPDRCVRSVENRVGKNFFADSEKIGNFAEL